MSFGVDTDAMSSAATKIGHAAEQLQLLGSKIEKDVQTMMGGWQGEGATAHQDLHQRYIADLRSVINNLHSMQAALQSTHQLYVSQESAQRADHNSMRNTIAL